ncbi:MAG: Transcriptional regulator, IclR family [uncultured Rubrobacteraceae bacterium]|uniref:Transcriptional regulator, IclR family n=1 Tax=uncultured Rubrobacteraceae bacterium TaxID=349277 RepID=A0A6J4QBH1_9ACTN|nr:MAG: Transcriptional regulator, IclR family [uncultured Rubrobacteraceae bacterium]
MREAASDLAVANADPVRANGSGRHRDRARRTRVYRRVEEHRLCLRLEDYLVRLDGNEARRLYYAGL